MATKKVIKYFGLFEHEKEQEYLREMHKSGWKLVKVTGLSVYHFEQCEPQDVVYQLDYNKEGLNNKDEYIKMFADCGWEYVNKYLSYAYFRKPAEEMNGNEEIFCDYNSRLQMMKRVLLTYLLLISINFIILIPSLVQYCFMLFGHANATVYYGNFYPTVVAFFIIYTVLTLTWTILFIRSVIGYKKYKNKINNN